ncbi:MAG: hypothetical protein JWQ97_1387 [Phenylobacterium sp.]|nr:hypothetical protein [Phenylobacterium sp.]
MTDMSALRVRPSSIPPGEAGPAPAMTHPDPMPRVFGQFERDYYEGGTRPGDVVDAKTFDYLADRLHEGRYPFLSLDVFDTLLLRNDKCERRRFWEIAERWEKLLPLCSGPTSCMDLYLARVRAAEICYSCGPILASTQEGRLDSLVGVMLSLLNLPQDLLGEFMSAELAYEAENLTPNPVIVSLVEQHRRNGGDVMLLSDMYVSGAQIHGMLRHFGIGDISAHIYSSADSTVNKRSGTIFGPAARAIGADPREIFHIGDNYTSDFAMPRLSGWAAQHLPVPLCEERLRERDLRTFLETIAGVER